MTSTKPSVRIERITPVIADKYLGTQLANRKLRDSRVDYWVALIEAGEWRLSNDAIAFDQNGHLINGQHRLTAVVVTGVSLEFIVARNLATTTQDIMDSGLMRATGDALRLRGEGNVTALAAALRWESKLRRAEANPENAMSHLGNKFQTSTPQLLAIFEEDSEGWRESTRLMQNIIRQVRMRPGCGTTLHRRFGLLSASDRDAFFHGLSTGESLTKTSPILLLRNQLMHSSGIGLRKMQDFREVALIIKAWNMWREGEEAGNLAWKYGATYREDFPFPR